MSKVVVYTKENCPQCSMTKMVLEQNGVEFTAIDVMKDEEARKYVVEELGLSAMPVVVIEGQEPFTGFHPDKLEKLSK
ncbi:glutaredoxin family protein [Bacillus mojavensis]